MSDIAEHVRNEITRGKLSSVKKLMRDDPLRGTGRTTRLVYKAICEALNRGKSEFVDHTPHTRDSARGWVQAIKSEARNNRLCLRVKRVGSRVYIEDTYGRGGK